MSSQRDPNSTSAERPAARRKSDDAIEVRAEDAVEVRSVDTIETNIRDGTAATQPAATEPAEGAAKKPTSSVWSKDADALAPATRIGQYVIEEAHSRGGFATVYRANHEKIGRLVALKVLHAALASTPNIVKRFEQEARAVNRIRHPNIVDITDYGELPDGRPFFVMEWLSGSTLKHLVHQRGALSQDDALRICEDIIPALAAAHEHGIIHRDLKLSNVIGVPKGDWFHFKLLDFGIAKVIAPEGLTDGLMTTLTGNRVGSPLTMAPEQIRCQPVDARTDIYALGVMLFELVTGKPPYRGKTAIEVEKLHLKAPVPSANELAPVSAGVSTVISRCMQKAQDDRYSQVNEVLTHLRKAVADASIDDPTLRQPVRHIPGDIAPKPPRRTGLWIALGAIAVIAVGAVVALTSGDSKAGDDAAKPAKSVTPTETTDASPPAPEPKKPKPKPPAIKTHAGNVTQLVGTFKPERFDITASLTTALKVARQHYADATLIKIEADNVTPDGTANLVLGKTSIVRYQFRSDSRSTKPGSEDLQGSQGAFCLYYVYADKRRYYHYPVSEHDCTAPLLGPPKCSAAEVWEKARKRGVPADLKVAKLQYTAVPRSKKRRATWIFSAGTKLELKLPDDCKK